ncbi:MAG: DNA polymerase III subunit beta [Clostridia bacterium]|nr:DNA polymerase III subunit beta [Clostridia bacterium]
MKIICSTQELTQACLNVGRCIPAKAVVPHLECILIETVESSAIRLSGFDLDLGIRTQLPVRVEREGAVVLNAKMFCDILRGMPEDSVLIDCDEKNVCVIKSGNTEYKLISLSPEEYPELPEVAEKRPFRIRQTVLRDMIRQTIFAVSVDDSKSVHRGVKFEIRQGEVKLVAIDGYRLALRTEFIEYVGEDISFVVPAKTLSEVIKFIDDEEAFIEVNVGRKHIIFDIGDYHMISRLLEGEFLDYKTAIPTAKSATVRVKTKSLIDCIERASIIITEKIKSPIKFIFDEDTIKISAVTAMGSANDKIAGSTEGKRTEIGFNNRFMLDALRSCDTDEVLIHLNGPVSPAVIVPPESDSFLYLILPVRIKSE